MRKQLRDMVREMDDLLAPVLNLDVKVPPRANFEVVCGDDEWSVSVAFVNPKTLGNRIKWWLFCQFFPFRIKRWDK